MAARVDMGKTLSVGDEGIWVTFARGMGPKAVREFAELCDERLLGVESSTFPDCFNGNATARVLPYLPRTIIIIIIIIIITIITAGPRFSCFRGEYSFWMLTLELSTKYAKSMYGIENAASTGDGHAEDTLSSSSSPAPEASQDIEASIEAELHAMKAKPKPPPADRRYFTPISTGVECLFFMKTIKPIEPGKLIRKMCEDARDCPDPRLRKCRYINRLTPVFDTDKATENGVVKVAGSVLPTFFTLKDKDKDKDKDGDEDGDRKDGDEDGDQKDGDEDGDKKDGDEGERQEKRHGDDDAAAETRPAYSYAIRHNIRNHNALKSVDVIKKVANLIDDKHKVNLGQPDKVILIEIFQLFCGISVVDGKEWEELRRYNLNALYSLATPDGKKETKG
ncbi:THUMP domain containing protein [Moelleriella libera RCEF 2490]|uniref:THUMP domain containing protein n=1 Tax=Moelleriella libera RCEF 2490 TaxID=1081109 RepID=A0A168A3Z9_9HYPO|nr:THUMP domain containing protein [Moelleriella libera RCEF 2490]